MPVRINSQQNKRSNQGNKGQIRSPFVAVEGNGRPLTKHQQRARICNSQGGVRKAPTKQPFSTNNNANSGFQTQQPAGSHSQNQFVMPPSSDWGNNLRNQSVKHGSAGF